MAYSVDIKEPAVRKLKTFDREIQHHFAKRIDKLAQNPQAFGKPLSNIMAGYWEAYFENRFRIIYTVDNSRNQISIHAIKHKYEF